MVQPTALAPNERGGEESAGDIHPRDFLSESEIGKREAAENRKYVYHGEISPAMRVRLEIGAAPEIIPRHRLHKDCKSCKNCPVCYETAPGNFIKLATRTFQHALQQVWIQDMSPPLPEAGIAKYAEYTY